MSVKEDEGMARNVLLGPAAVCAIILSTRSALADADLEQGDQTWNKWCVKCHSLDPDKKMLGPTLHGIFGREAGSIEGFKYSTALKRL